MGAPRVSCIVTCFNLGAYLPETLASIRAQTYRDLEICVIDDGSTDPLTDRVLRALPRDVAVVRSENRGLSAARNLGVARTSGEFICTVDADDLLAPLLLERSVSRLDADPSLAFVSHWLEAFGDESWEWKPTHCGFPALLDYNTVNGAALVRRTAVEAVGGWDEGMRDGCEDWDFWITLVERGFRGDIIPEVLFRYRRRPDSMSRVKFADDGLARLYRQIVEKHAGTFQTQCLELAIRREVDTAGNRAMADDLEERVELELRPALGRARDDLAGAEGRRLQWEQERSKEAERQHLCLALEESQGQARTLRDENLTLREQTEALRGELDGASTHATHLRNLHHQAMYEIAAIRSSWSWRLTGPLRLIGALLLRTVGRRS